MGMNYLMFAMLLVGCAQQEAYVPSTPHVVPVTKPSPIKFNCPDLSPIFEDLNDARQWVKSTALEINEYIAEKHAEAVAKKPKPVPYLEYHTAKWCIVCKRWKAVEYPEFIKAGWLEGYDIRTVDHGDGVDEPRLPVFKLRDGDGVLIWSVTEYQTAKFLSERYNEYMRTGQ